MRQLIVMGCIALAVLPAPPVRADGPPTPALVPTFGAGAKFANVFSRTISIRAGDFDEYVSRVAGSAVYTVRDAEAPTPRLHIDYHYDGLNQGGGSVELRKDGAVSCFNGKCAANTDASGLAYNPLLWGAPPARLHIGQTWSVRIDQAWELGPAGRETVTVLALDRHAHSVTLMREGWGQGAFNHDRLAVELVRDGTHFPVTVVPGRAHWVGYTTFHAGIVFSDDLVVERPVQLKSRTLGTIDGSQREFILLNAMPVSTWTGKRQQARISRLSDASAGWNVHEEGRYGG